jgi:ribosomal protein L14
MVMVQSLIKISDNSGALIGKCIRVVKNNSLLGLPGDVVLVTIKKVFEKKHLKKSKRIKKGQLCKILLLRTVRAYKR